MAQIETFLLSRFWQETKKKEPVEHLKQTTETWNLWLETAFSIGDETYLNFTKGKRLYPVLDTYSPYENEQEGESL